MRNVECAVGDAFSSTPAEPLAMSRQLAINDRVSLPLHKKQGGRSASTYIEGRTMRRTEFSILSLILPLLIIIGSPVFAQTSSTEEVLKTRTDLVNVGVLAKEKK